LSLHFITEQLQGQRKIGERRTATPRPRQKRNKALWFFFTEERDIDGEWNIARCNTCSKTVKRKSASTTGMTLHLQIHHPELQEMFLDMLKNDKRDKVKKLYVIYTERFGTKIEKQE
jgi:hypothetical protein